MSAETLDKAMELAVKQNARIQELERELAAAEAERDALRESPPEAMALPPARTLSEEEIVQIIHESCARYCVGISTNRVEYRVAEAALREALRRIK